MIGGYIIVAGLIIMVILSLLGLALMAGLIWSVTWLVRDRKMRVRSPFYKLLYIPAGLFAGALLVLLCFVVKKTPEDRRIDSQFPAGPYDMTSPELKPFNTMYLVPRAQHGFTAFPKHADVMIETRTGADAKDVGYDAMLHIYVGERIHSGTEWDVSFKRVNNKYQWIGESETWTGPHGHMTPDGEFVIEEISISYDTQPTEGGGDVNALQINYIGPDVRLSGKDNLTLKAVRPVLKQWGA